MKTVHLILCLFLLCLFALAGCSNANTQKYLAYTQKIIRIIEDNKNNTDICGEKVLQYVTANQAAITATLKNMSAFTIDQTKADYNSIMQQIDKINQLINEPITVYPDSVRDVIKNTLKENQELIDANINQLTEETPYYLKKNFTVVAARLLLIKQLITEFPVQNFSLTINPQFIEAAQILNIDNLVLPEEPQV